MRNLLLCLTVLTTGLCRAAAAQPSADDGAALQDATGRYTRTAQAVENAVRGYGRPVKVLVQAQAPADLDRYSHDLFRRWKLAKNGLLICVCVDSRKVAMTAGPALEAKGVDGAFLRDRVIPDQFKPGWKAGGLDEAVRRSLGAVDARLAQRQHPGAPVSASAQPSEMQPPGYQPGGWEGPSAPQPSAGPAAFAPLFILFVLVAISIAIVVGVTRGGARGGPYRTLNPTAQDLANQAFLTTMQHSALHAAQTAQTATPFDTSPPMPSIDTSPPPAPMDTGSTGGGFSDTGSGSF